MLSRYSHLMLHARVINGFSIDTGSRMCYAVRGTEYTIFQKETRFCVPLADLLYITSLSSQSSIRLIFTINIALGEEECKATNNQVLLTWDFSLMRTFMLLW